MSAARRLLPHPPPGYQVEVLDGQQRITSIGRFVTGKFAIKQDGKEQTFSSLPAEARGKILKSPLLVYHCQGTEKEIKEWSAGRMALSTMGRWVDS